MLAGQLQYLPLDGAIAEGQLSQLQAISLEAQHDGFALRVAVIATRADLGSVTALWRRPQSYARFLALELAQVFHGTLLVAMPNGYGVADVGGSARAPSPSLSGLPAPGTGASLARGALTAIQRVAAADGHRLTIVPARRGAGSRGPAARSGIDVAAVLALVVGALLLAAAWAASIRARPLRRGNGVASSHGS